jgi:hypothetical protein
MHITKECEIMWAKLKYPFRPRFIELPLAWSKSYGFTTHIRFGGRVVRAGIRFGMTWNITGSLLNNLVR